MNTNALKLFAQQTRQKLLQQVETRMNIVLNEDTAELRGKQQEINALRKEIASKGEKDVKEEVAYTWFNRVMALRFMDANGYNVPMVVTPADGQIRPEILQEALGGSIDESLALTPEEMAQPEEKLYRTLFTKVCKKNHDQMPFLFETINDYTELLLPTDLLSEQSFVTNIRKGMTDEDCQNVEIMGWLYQFYITDRKADAETKKSKKGGLKSDEQAAATQLFTPHWIVRYMVENTLGRIWTALHPDTALKAEMTYYIEPADGEADPIPEDIKSVKDIRFLDPCMGSGHVLVYAFDLLCKMYEEEGYRTKEIPTLIFENNLYGMDIDKRCYQLASFALTMKATGYYSRYLRREPIAPKVIYLQNIDHDTIAASGDWDEKSLVWQFEHIDTIGSLLKITPEEYENIKVENGLWGEQLRVMKSEAEYLSRGYHCVVTNPPYLGKGISDILKAYCTEHFKEGKADMFAAFIMQAVNMLVPKGFTGLVTMESWMFLSGFEKLRDILLNKTQFISLSHFDWHIMHIAFGTVSFILQNIKPDSRKGVYSYLRRNEVDLQKDLPYSFPNKSNGRYNEIQQEVFKSIVGHPIGYWVTKADIKAFDFPSISTIADARKGNSTTNNDRFLRLWYEIDYHVIAIRYKDVISANIDGKYWIPYNKGGGYRRWYGFNQYLVFWKENGKEIRNAPKSVVTNEKYYMRPGSTWAHINSIRFSCRYFDNGFIFDNAGNCLFSNENDIFSLNGFLNSKVFQFLSEITNPTLGFSSGEVAKMPYNKAMSNNTKISNITKLNINIARKDWDAHETSWDFTTSPILEAKNAPFDLTDGNMLPAENLEECKEILEEKRNLLSFCVSTYKQKWEALLYRLHSNEEELNRMFIDIYGLQDELTPDVPLNEVTILQQGEISIEKSEESKDGVTKSEKLIWHDDVIIKQFISYLVGCFMGRFSPDKPGLIIANQHQDLTTLGLQVDGIESSPRSTLSIDDDGIVPIIQEPDFFADDMTERIQLAIKQLFGEATYYENMKYIEQTIGKSLRDYLFKDYYADHQQMYSVKGAKRPIYWLFSSRMGDKHKKGYFKALVYMHRMEADTLSKLHADYVHPYINKVEQQLREAEDESLRDDLTQAQHNRALKLVNELKDKVKEVKEFEQQLVEMASHRLTIDLDDGVKANYPKFYPLVEPIKGLE